VYTEIKNFVEDYSILEKTLVEPVFPWFYYKVSVDTDSYKNEFVPSSVLRHSFISNGEIISSAMYLIEPILDKIANHFGDLVIRSVHANLLLSNASLCGKCNPPHIDTTYTEEEYLKYNTYTALYYLTDSDAKTVLYDDEYNGSLVNMDVNNFISLVPEKNKFVYWDSKRYHSSPAASSSNRVVINFNFMSLK
jgi:hypothetical protein